MLPTPDGGSAGRGSEAANPPPRLVVPDRCTLSALRTAFAREGYTRGRVARALGRRPPVPETRPAVYARRVSELDGLGTLVLLFRLGVPVGRAAAARALAPADLDVLFDSGLLEERGDQVASTVGVSHDAGLLLAHDAGPASGRSPAWHVLGVTPGSRTLAALTIRKRVRAALDVGTGCGIQALLAARHAERVVATDLNKRALIFTRINAGLNGLANVECRHGDLFAPVRDERFELVVSNPPFVVSPAADLMFRDAELPGDELSRQVVAEASDHLAKGGHATVLCNWIWSTGTHWSEPPREWLRGRGCDALLLHFTADDPLTYASKWTDDLDRWLAYYRRSHIERISLGAAVVRRAGPPGRIIALQASAAPLGDAGEQLLRVFAAADDATSDEALLDARFRLAEHQLTQTARYRRGRYAVETTLVSIPGAPLNAHAETDAIHVLARLDGTAPLSVVIERAARETRLDRARLQAAALRCLRRLYVRGFLIRERGQPEATSAFGTQGTVGAGRRDSSSASSSDSARRSGRRRRRQSSLASAAARPDRAS